MPLMPWGGNDRVSSESTQTPQKEHTLSKRCRKTKKEVILDMYQNGCNLELIATVTKKNISEIEEIINNSIVSLH